MYIHLIFSFNLLNNSISQINWHCNGAFVEIIEIYFLGFYYEIYVSKQILDGFRKVIN